MLGKLAALLDWCRLHHIKIDERLHVSEDEAGAMAVYSRNATIDTMTTVVHIPRSAVLSVKTCDPALALRLMSVHVPYGIEAQLYLALALCYELLLDISSPWYGYLQSLPPPKSSNLAVFWPDIPILCESREVPSDASDAYGWTRGTELAKTIRRPDGTTILDMISRFYVETVVSIFHEVDPTIQPSLDGFCHAYALVSSRAFLVDAYHGLAMVPIADAFNHIQENHVHLETEYDVCDQCGSLEECPHDREGSERAPVHAASNIAVADDCYEMVTNAVILPQEEVFNTYGEHLSNAELLAQYGFMLEGNENDMVTWDVPDLTGDMGSTKPDRAGKPEDDSGRYVDDDIQPRKRRRLSTAGHERTSKGTSPSQGSLEGDALLKLVTEAIRYFPVYEGWDRSALVQNIDQENGPHASEQRSVFRLNADGRISHELWCFVATKGLHRIEGSGALHRSGGSSGEVLRRAADLQMSLDGEDNAPSERSGEGPTVATTTDGARQHAMEIAREVVRMCEHRRSLMARSSSSAVGELLDDLPEEMKKTRMAMTEAMAELSMLESCESAWKDLLEAC